MSICMHNEYGVPLCFITSNDRYPIKLGKYNLLTIANIRNWVMLDKH